MKKLRIAMIFLFSFVFAFVLTCPVHAESTDPQEILRQYVADLQKSPNDHALREKIIKLAQEMKPAPAIPEEAREHYVMAATFVEKAKDNSGFERAIEQYRAALLAAPWWADAYKKLAISQKAAAHYDDAVASLNLYLLTQPADARDAQDEIYKLKALKQSATEDQVKKQREKQQRDAPKILLRQLKAQYEGATYLIRQCSHASQEVCFNEAGMFPCGCNQAERDGNTWYRMEGVCRVSFPADGTILFYVTKSFQLRGTPKGPVVEDIVWEGANGENAWAPVWVHLEGGLDRIWYSPKNPFMRGLERPVDDSLYRSEQRYGYTHFRKQ